VSEIDFKKLTEIKHKQVLEKTIIHYPEVKELCKRPYPNHKKGCPNIEKCKGVPEFSGKYNFFYLTWIKFNFKEYKNLRKKEHPNWTEDQVKCLLYWQNSLKKLLKNHLEELSQNNKFYVFGCGNKFKLSFQSTVDSMEASCINVFSTLKINKIKIDIKINDLILLCCLLCSHDPIVFNTKKTDTSIMDFCR